MRSDRMTEHAQKRKQQRGISDLQVELLNIFGEDHYQKGGCSLSYIPERKLAMLRNAIDNLSNVALVKDASGRGITMMHMNRRVSKTQYVA
jgi:hypothetical protein